MSRKNSRKPGVYQILNTVTNDLYIGSSSLNIHYRWSDHKSMLNTNRHGNAYLQRAWVKYGAKSFEWSVIEYCDNSLDREQYWIDNLKPAYNIHRQARGATGIIRSWETRVRISLSRKGKCAGADHYRYGKSVDQDIRNRISQSLKEAYAQGLAVSPMKGKTHNAEVRATLSAAQLGNSKRRDSPTYRNIMQYDLSGIFIALHPTARIASDSIGRLNKPDSSKILRSCKETHRTCFGYRWRFLVDVQLKPGELLEA